MKILKLLYCFLLVSFTAHAQTDAFPSAVNVTGTGLVKVVPDQVMIGLKVENTGKDAAAVKRQNDQTVREVLAFLKSAGIPDTDIQTEYIRLNKNFEYSTKTYNYMAYQTISLHLKDISKYEAIMDGLLTSGVNGIDNVVFGSSKQEQLESEARVKAIQNAKMKATEYATALNQTVGAALQISEQSASLPRPLYRASAIQMNESAPALAPGELEIRVNVQVSFVLYPN